MFKNYLKTSYRFLFKNRTFSFINIFGLALGTLCCMYIILYVTDQYSYDRHQRDAKDIYRVTANLSLSGDKHVIASIAPPIVPTMKKDFGEVIEYTRLVPTLGAPKHLLKYKEKSFYEENQWYADSTFFNIFSYHFIYGNPSVALKEPFSVVLMKKVSDKLFGNESPINKTISIEDSYGVHDYTITGVIDESLGKSNIDINYLVSMRGGGMGDYTADNGEWAGNNYTTSYVKLRPDTHVGEFEKKLVPFMDKYAGQNMKTMGMQKQLHLQPLLSVHTTDGYEIGMGKTVSATFLKIMILIAVLIQVIACINFMNLSTARASGRAREVGVRKVIGAGRFSLIKQFLAESLLLSFAGILIALPLLIFAMPFLNSITEADIHISLLRDYRLWIFLFVLVLLTGLAAGSYPAFYLSAFQPVKVIKGNFTNQVSATGIRKSLVVFQFVLSIVLITSIVIIYSQLSFVRNKDLGFDKKQKMVFSFFTPDAQSRMSAFADEIQKLPEVREVSMSNYHLGQFVSQDHGVYPPGGSMKTAIDVQNISTDQYFIETNGIKILSGRDFRKTDSGKVLINETTCKRLGLKSETAPGTRLYSEYKPDPPFYVEVVGVMKDFNYNSLHSEVKPFMLNYEPHNNKLSNLTVSVNSDNYKSIIDKMRSIWQKTITSIPFEYEFMDEIVQKQYQSDVKLGNIINSFTLIAILISCLGLFGLSSFSAEQRSKEIGIRKVLGASVSGIVQLLSGDFLKLILISIVIAIPISWWAMNKWLEGFNYRVPISWWMFGLSGLIAIGIAPLTVSFQSIKAATANPVRSLKSE